MQRANTPREGQELTCVWRSCCTVQRLLHCTAPVVALCSAPACPEMGRSSHVSLGVEVWTWRSWYEWAMLPSKATPVCAPSHLLLCTVHSWLHCTAAVAPLCSAPKGPERYRSSHMRSGAELWTWRSWYELAVLQSHPTTLRAPSHVLLCTLQRWVGSAEGVAAWRSMLLHTEQWVCADV
jgi:hypothetical protein